MITVCILTYRHNQEMIYNYAFTINDTRKKKQKSSEDSESRNGGSARPVAPCDIRLFGDGEERSSAERNT